MNPSPRLVKSIDNEQESQRAARLRDNKRRNRQRQKDYTSSLETKLKELQSQGVQATQEVQLSARKVVEDNARLKALLRHVGVSDHVIETWTPSVAVTPTEKPSSCEKKCTGTVNRKDRLIGMDSAPFLTATIQTMEPAISQPLPTLSIQKSNQNKSNGRENMRNLDMKSTESPSLTVQLAPCKILTRLAENPGADVRQPSTEGENLDDQENGGVECSKAHNMLMQFATTEEKLDIISQALEQGCVGKASGGCKVRNEAIWKAIDDVT